MAVRSIVQQTMAGHLTEPGRAFPLSILSAVLAIHALNKYISALAPTLAFKVRGAINCLHDAKSFARDALPTWTFAKSLARKLQAGTFAWSREAQTGYPLVHWLV